MNCGKEPDDRTFVAEIRKRMREIDLKLVLLAGDSGLCSEQGV
jgi:predicted GTPase